MAVRARRAVRVDQKDQYVGCLSVYTYETRATRVVETISSLHESGSPGHCSACILGTIFSPIYAAGLVGNKFATASLDGR